MAGTIKGVTVEFNAKDTALKTALNSIKSEASAIQRELNAVNRQLRFDPKNTELLKQKQTLLKQEIEATKTELTQFKDVQNQLDQKKISKTSAEYMKVRREIIAAQSKLRRFNAELARAKWNGVKTFGTDIQSVGQKLTRATRYARMFAAAIAGIALYKGFQRLKALDEVSKQLEVLGYRGEKLDGIMNDVSDSVNGTRFMLQDMAKVATGALGSGVTDSYKLNEYLTRTADLAQLAGIDVQSMGAMLNKAYSKGKVDAKIMNQLNAHGIPIYKLMQKQLKVTADELQDMSKKGKLSFDDLYKATSRYQGLAQKMGTETLPGALTVLQQQFGLIGADFLEGVYEPLKTGVKGIVASIKELRKSGTFKQWGQDLGDTVRYFSDYFTKGSASMDGLSDRARNLVTVLSPLVTSIGNVVSVLAKLPPELQGVLAFMTIIGGPLLTGVGSAVVGFANLAANVQTFVMNVQSGVGPLSQLSAGTTGLTGIMGLLLNPLTLATAGIGAYALAITKANSELHKSTTAFEEWKAGNNAGIESARSAGAEVDVYRQKLTSLMAKEKKSAGDKALIKTYVDKLNSAVAGLNLKYDEEKDKLNKTAKAIDNKIKKYKEAAVVKAYEDLITEAAKKEAEEQLHLQELYEERKRVQDKWNKSAEHSATLELQYKQTLAEVDQKIRDSKNAINGYRSEMDRAAGAVETLKNKSKKGFRQTANVAKAEAKDAGTSFPRELKKGAEGTATAAKAIAESAKKGLHVDTSGLGKDFANGFKNGITSKVSEIATAAANLVKRAVSAARRAQKSGSPSKVMRQVGREYGQGDVLGIEDMIPAVQRAANKLIGASIQSATIPTTSPSLQASGGQVVNLYNTFNISGENSKEISSDVSETLMQLVREGF